MQCVTGVYNQNEINCYSCTGTTSQCINNPEASEVVSCSLDESKECYTFYRLDKGMWPLQNPQYIE